MTRSFLPMRLAAQDFSEIMDGNYARMLRAILNKSWRQHPTRHQLYGHLPPITKTIQVRRPRPAGHCWRSKDELISDVVLWIPAYGQAKAGRLPRTYIQQLCEDTGCSPKDLPEVMNDREKWRGSGIFVLAARLDDDDIYIYVSVCVCKFLPGSGHIDTAIWMHYMDANKTAGEETRWQLHKNAACNPEQVLAATPHKTPTVRPPAPYHENYSS